VRLADFLDKGASISPSGARCLTMGDQARTYADVQRLSWLAGRALARSGIRPGDKVAILSGNDPVAFSCVFGISRAGATWCPVNPRGEAAENQELLDLLDCRALLYAPAFAPLVAKITPGLPQLETLVRLTAGDTDAGVKGAVGFGEWVSGLPDDPWQAAAPADDVVMIAGTGGTTGRPKGVQLTGHTIEAMTALTLMSYPFRGRPVYLALAPLTHAAGVLCFPVMALGGEVVIMPRPDLGEFLALAQRHRVTHAFLPPTVIYQLLDRPEIGQADLRASPGGATPRTPRGRLDGRAVISSRRPECATLTMAGASFPRTSCPGWWIVPLAVAAAGSSCSRSPTSPTRRWRPTRARRARPT
jgi:fatty-acyl-CoA synthase